MDLIKVKKLNISLSTGCYKFIDSRGKIIYIGKAAKLRNRVASYWRVSMNHTPAKSAMLKEIKKIDWIETDSEIEALLLESNLIKKYQPVFNIDLRDDKRFTYIKVSLEDEIPGVFATRKIDKSGKYFGPFTSAGAVRETLKVIRKIWPYCAERRIKKKPCFFAQINRCTGVCGGQYKLDEYKKKIVIPIVKFLEGKKRTVINEMKREEKRLEKNGDNKGAAQIKFRLKNMEYVLEHTNILSITEKYAADVVELAKVLGLPRVPERIEGYDISNIFGQEAVGSMVVFSGGEPNKNEYRKFKIKIGQGRANDVGMLREVLERRFKHSEPPPNIPLRKGEELKKVGVSKSSRPMKGGNREGSNRWPLSDLIIVDGGKGQLNAATRAVKKAKLDIPVIAVSKGAGLRSAMAPDKIFFPGEKKPLELPPASPAIHIIKRVRDEAHRFAIKYHQLLRKKKMFG